MDLIYLDQNHFGRIAHQRLGTGSDEAVAYVDQRLKRLVASGRVLCPFSEYHVYETLKYDHDSARAAICDLVGDLSRGQCFKHPLDRVTDELQDFLDVTCAIRSRADPVGRPLGHGLDCFPRSGIADETRASLGALPARGWFGQIVEDLRLDPSLRKHIEVAVGNMLDAEASALPKRKVDRLRLPEAIAVQTREVLNTPELTSLIRSVGERSGIPHPQFWFLIEAAGLSRLPTVATFVAVRARRETKYTMKPDPGDPFDAAHVTVTPYVRILATDGRARDLTTEAAKSSGTTLVASPQELADALDAAYPPSR